MWVYQPLCPHMCDGSSALLHSLHALCDGSSFLLHSLQDRWREEGASTVGSEDPVAVSAGAAGSSAAAAAASSSAARSVPSGNWACKSVVGLVVAGTAAGRWVPSASLGAGPTLHALEQAAFAWDEVVAGMSSRQVTHTSWTQPHFRFNVRIRALTIDPAVAWVSPSPTPAASWTFAPSFARCWRIRILWP